MATAKPKVKRMMAGGMNFMGKPSPKQMQNKPYASPPIRTQSQMQAAQKAPMAPPRPGTAGPRSAPPPAFPAKSKPQQVPSQLASLSKALNAQKSGKMGVGSQAASKTGLGNALRGLGVGAAGAARGMMKKGGAVKKATKK